MTRRSPYKHTVRAHIRSGVQVSQYERGRGVKPSKPRVARPSSLAGWRVTAYHSRGSDSRRVRAGDMTEAVMVGLPLLELPEPPERVRVRRLSDE